VDVPLFQNCLAIRILSVGDSGPSLFTQSETDDFAYVNSCLSRESYFIALRMPNVQVRDIWSSSDLTCSKLAWPADYDHESIEGLQTMRVETRALAAARVL
jgi:hypothetical protein